MPSERRTLPPGGWPEIRDRFAWRVPDDFAIWRACADDWAAAEPGRTAIIDRGGGGRRVWTYGDLKDASDRLAQHLAGAGLRSGDVAAVLLPQSAEVVVAHLAIQKLGAIVLPLFTLFGPEALTYRIEDSGARAVVSDGAGLARLGPLGDSLIRISTDGAGGDDLGRILAEGDPLARPADTRADDPAVMIYTSGTTGPPKGALHAHRFLIGHLPCVEMVLEGFPKPRDVAWTPADWAWIGGLMDLAMPALYFGAPLVAHRMRKFEADAAWRLMREEGVTVAFLPPTALKMLRQAAPPEGLRLRAISSGGESLPEDLIRWGREALGAPINELYGQTECNLVVATGRGLGNARAGTMGRAVPGHEVAVIDGAGQEVPRGETGEIAVRRPDPVMFLEYWKQPDKTRAKFTGDWMRTGDLGRMDEDGFLTFVARDDDIINSAGYRIGPTEIENCLTGDPDVVMAAAVGVPDPDRGEVVKAFVVLREGASEEGAERRLIDRVRERVSPHVAPRRIDFVADLPMTATGKIMRRELRGKG